MHYTARLNCKYFFDTYAVGFPTNDTKVVEIGSRDVNGSLRGYCPSTFGYTGVDFDSGKGVDIVLDDPYSLPFETGTVDIVLSSSCFEHSEMFWVLFLEIMRILKPVGLFYINVPSNGVFHQYPVDCWRFYPDSGRALVAWAKRNGMDIALLESYTSIQKNGTWNDYVAVFVKDKNFAAHHRGRILYSNKDIYNGVLLNTVGYVNYRSLTEDMVKQSQNTIQAQPKSNAEVLEELSNFATAQLISGMPPEEVQKKLELMSVQAAVAKHIVDNCVKTMFDMS